MPAVFTVCRPRKRTVVFTAAYAARLPVLYLQLADLQLAIDGLIADVRDGTRRFVPYQSLKLYGQ